MEQSAHITHRPVSTIGPFLAIQNTAMNLRDHGVGVHNAVMDIGNNYVGGYCELGLGVNNQ